MKKLILTGIVFSMLLSCMPAFGLSLTDFTTRVRAYLYETDSTNTIYDATLFTEVANRVQAALVDMLPLSANPQLIKYGSMAIYPGFSTIAFTLTNYRKIISLMYDGRAAIQAKPQEWLALRSKATVKDPYFAVFGNYIFLQPAATATTSVELVYQSPLAPLTTGANLFETTAEFDNLLVILGTIHILYQDNQPQRAASLEKLVTLYVSLIQKNMTNTNIIEPTQDGVK